MSKWIDKSPQSDVRLRHLELTDGAQPFYSTKLDVNDEVIQIGKACSVFQRRLASIPDLGDVATPEQNGIIENLVEQFLEESGLGAYKRQAVALRLENGKLRKKLEGDDE